MSSLFTKIINQEIPCHKVAETEDYLAFLDINPLVMGHVLCIPKKEVDYIFDLEDETLAGLMLFSKKVAIAIDKAVDCKRVGVAVIGLEVPHAHVHLVPLQNVGDINFSKEKLSPSKEELASMAKSIQSNN
jgi:histidine triad (HIT) family protein